MAFTKVTTPTALAGKLITLTLTTSTAEDHVTGVTSGRIYQVKIDNTANTTPVYVKIGDTTDATTGTTIADLVLYTPIGETLTYLMDAGHAYTAGVSVWCTTGASTGDAGDPSESVTVTILAS
tara:strand:+ start:845 stop:1213 length:369 start_codon:yes stop_codon:yes gene_type:complete